MLEKRIYKCYLYYIDPNKRIALSIRFPFLKNIIMTVHRFFRKTRWFFDFHYNKKHNDLLLPYVVKKHKSVLMRKLWSTDIQLQKNKKINLLLAGKKINKSVIYPWKKRSFWQHIWLPNYADWYKDGVLLYQWNVISWVWWGICQMANMLYWLVLHSPLSISEHYHHSYDVFPDSGRTLPFGSGATVVYNYVDLEFYNPTDQIFQFEIQQDDDFLYWILRSDTEQIYSYKIIEKNHNFISTDHWYFRYNELYQNKINKKTWDITNTKYLRTNFSPVLYELSEENKDNSFSI